jgi:hypothetical protein
LRLIQSFFEVSYYSFFIFYRSWHLGCFTSFKNAFLANGSLAFVLLATKTTNPSSRSRGFAVETLRKMRLYIMILMQQ